MDTDHRHELHQNDLVEFLGSFKAFWTKHGTKTLLIILALVLAFTLTRHYKTRQAQLRQAQLRDLAAANNPETLAAVANEYSDKHIRARALLKGADLSLTDAVGLLPPGYFTAGQDPNAPAPVTSDRTMAESLDKAEQMYNALLAINNLHPTYIANAKLGLAAVYETRGAIAPAGEADAHWKRAQTLYKEVQEVAGERFPVLAEQAKIRLGMLDRIRQPVDFAPDPVVDQPDGNAAAGAPADVPLEVIEPDDDEGDDATPAAGEADAADEAVTDEE